MSTRLLVVALLVLVAPTYWCQKSESWDHCKCSWEKWMAWSKCTKLCYGHQIRYRSVWKSNGPECGGVTACDGGKGSHQVQLCNKVCKHGHWDVSKMKCVCPKGMMGVCCDEDIKCAVPEPIPHGKANGTVVVYGQMVGFECEDDYHLFGTNSVICGEHGLIGDIPKCTLKSPCSSNPCPPGRMCVEDGNSFRCDCPVGMAGDSCTVDTLPPKVVNCSDDVTVRTRDERETYRWNPPQFVDPKGSNISVTSNFQTPHYYFPWGDFVVQYLGTKVSNGLQAKCEFTVRVRPIPCPKMSPPRQGYLVCNDWRTEFGSFCLIGCKQGHSLPRGFSDNQWLVCGSSGHWTPGNVPSECQENIGSKRSKSTTLPPLRCDDKVTVQQVKKLYIEKLQKSDFKPFCKNFCNEKNVSISC